MTNTQAALIAIMIQETASKTPALRASIATRVKEYSLLLDSIDAEKASDQNV